MHSLVLLTAYYLSRILPVSTPDRAVLLILMVRFIDCSTVRLFLVNFHCFEQPTSVSLDFYLPVLVPVVCVVTFYMVITKYQFGERNFPCNFIVLYLACDVDEQIPCLKLY